MTSELPRTLDSATDPRWLTKALAPVYGKKRVTDVEVVEVIRVNATKVRFKAHFDDGAIESYCLKAFLDQPDDAGGNSASVREANFYNLLADKISVRVPECVVAPVDEKSQFGILIMRDMIAEGARFCTALEAFDAERTAKSLEQLARLHTSHTTLGPVESIGWTPRQINWLADRFSDVTDIQRLINDPRSDGLPERMRDGELLLKGVKALATIDAQRPATLIHGDCHAGNIFETAEGLGLIDWQLLQQGGWALDLAYHMAAVMPVEVAEREERSLLKHYLETVRSLGGTVPDDEQAWLEYRMSPVYGLFLWGITRNVDRPIINVFFHRLASSVMRHNSYQLLGL